jgi:hypothetical protein
MGQIADVCILRKDLCKQIALHSAGSGAGETCRLLTGGLSGVLSFGGLSVVLRTCIFTRRA